MEDLSLHILDIAENSITAGASRIIIRIVEDLDANMFLLEISDNGKGMEKDMYEHACDPFYTTRTTRKVGLGIPLLAQSAQDCNGSLSIHTEKGKGTRITATFQHDHIDRKPLGDIDKTMIVLIASNPDIDFLLEYKKNNDMYILDTSELKKELEDVPINNIEVIKIIKDDIRAWLIQVNNMIK
ncbi:MAG: ATP-binding protein [Nitrospirota bacterium]